MIRGTNIQPKSKTTAGAIIIRAVDLEAFVAIGWCFPVDRDPIQDGTKVNKNVLAQGAAQRPPPGGRTLSGSLRLPSRRS